MSLLYTECFFAFGSYNDTDAYSTAVVNARNAHAANLMRAGYGVMTAANSSADTSGGFFIRPDPLYPTSRKVLAHSSSASAMTNLGVTAALKKKLPITDKQIILGFGVFIPADYVPNSASSTVPCFRLNATVDSDTTWYAAGITAGSPKECFRIPNDLSIRWGTDAPQTSRKLKVGAMNYLEVRISAAEVSVWLDDIFCLQKQVSLIPEAIAFIFENNANAMVGGTNMSGTPGRWCLEHMYYIAVDGVAPNVRLGPTTRIYGARPETDVDVRFIRPTAAPTNASVAAQDIVDSPTQQLQSTTIGDFDTYATTQSRNDILSMGMVHAVVSKALAANLEPDLHKIRPYVKYNGSAEGADQKTRELVALTSTIPRTIRAMAIRPSDNSVWVVGDGSMVFRSNPNFDLSVWNAVRNTGDGVNYLAIYVRPEDGAILIATSDSNILAVRAGSNTIDATTFLNTRFVTNFLRSPDGSRYFALPSQGNANLQYSADPWATTPAYSGGTITGISNTPSTYGGFSQIATKPGGASILAPATNTDNVYQTSTFSATGFTVTARPFGDSGYNYRAVVWDGTQFLIGATVNDGANNGGPRIRRSADGASWALATGAGTSLPGVNQQINYGVSNPATGQTMFIGDGGAIVVSTDGINWRQLPRITTNALYAGVVLPNGDFLLGGANGTLLRYQAPGADTTLYPLAGYGMAFGSAAFNPSTSAAWTPAQAADAQFGVRLTS